MSMVPLAWGTMRTGWGIMDILTGHVGGTFCTNKHNFNGETRNKKVTFNFSFLYFRDSVINKKHTYSSRMGYHGHECQ